MKTTLNSMILVPSTVRNTEIAPNFPVPAEFLGN